MKRKRNVRGKMRKSSSPFSNIGYVSVANSIFFITGRFVVKSYPQIRVLNICVNLSVKGSKSLSTHLKINKYF